MDFEPEFRKNDVLSFNDLRFMGKRYRPKKYRRKTDTFDLYMNINASRNHFY